MVALYFIFFEIPFTLSTSITVLELPSTRFLLMRLIWMRTESGSKNPIVTIWRNLIKSIPQINQCCYLYQTSREIAFYNNYYDAVTLLTRFY